MQEMSTQTTDYQLFPKKRKRKEQIVYDWSELEEIEQQTSDDEEE